MIKSRQNANLTSGQGTTRQRLSPQARREQLLDCAMRAFATSGIERAGHGDIAKLAGVSTGTVFNYFETRDALLDAVLSRLTERIMTLFDGLPQGTRSASEQIRIMATAYGVMTEQEPDMVKVYHNWSVAFGADVRPRFLALNEIVLDAIAKVLPGDRQDRSDARIIIAAANTFSLMKLDNIDSDIIQRFVDRVADVLD